MNLNILSKNNNNIIAATSILIKNVSIKTDANVSEGRTLYQIQNQNLYKSAGISFKSCMSLIISCSKQKQLVPPFRPIYYQE
mgnify:CR=1 FL=1